MPKIYYNKKIPADEHTLSLLHFDDPNNIVKDECGRTWYTSGSPTISTDNAIFGKALQLPNNSAQASAFGIAHFLESSDPITLGGSDFTVDCWALHVRTSYNPYFSGLFAFYDQKNNSTWRITPEMCNNGAFLINLNNNAAVEIMTVPSSFFDVMHHFAFVYQHGLSRLDFYLDGGLQKTFSITLNAHTYQYLRIGAINYESGNTTWCGTFDEFRISDCARWTANFTPPTEPYELGEHIETRSIELSEVN